MQRVYLGQISDSGPSQADVLQALDWLRWEDLVPSDARVFIKPNLTWPEHIAGVTTTPQAIEAVVAALCVRAVGAEKVVALMMPGKEYYVIQSGDYLQKIAKKYNMTVA